MTIEFTFYPSQRSPASVLATFRHIVLDANVIVIAGFDTSTPSPWQQWDWDVGMASQIILETKQMINAMVPVKMMWSHILFRDSSDRRLHFKAVVMKDYSLHDRKKQIIEEDREVIEEDREVIRSLGPSESFSAPPTLQLDNFTSSTKALYPSLEFGIVFNNLFSPQINDQTYSCGSKTGSTKCVKLVGEKSEKLLRADSSVPSNEHNGEGDSALRKNQDPCVLLKSEGQHVPAEEIRNPVGDISDLEELDNLQMKHGLALSWTEKRVGERWEVTGSLERSEPVSSTGPSLQFSLPIRKCASATSKQQAKTKCAALMLSVCGKQQLVTEQSEKLAADLSASEEESNKALCKQRVLSVLWEFGRQPVSAQEIENRVAASGFKGLSNERVNQMLCELLSEGKVKRHQVGVTGNELICWTCADLEKTSIEEAHELKALLNDGFSSEGENPYLANSSDNHQRLCFDVKYEWSEEQVRSLADDTSSIRFVGKATLVRKNPISLSEIVIAEGISPPCIEPALAKIHAHHALLKTMSCSPIFSLKFHKQCEQKHSLAYYRGRRLRVGEKFPCGEDKFLEFKGAKSEACSNWRITTTNYPFNTITRILAGFVNCVIFDKDIPASLPRIVLGVHDKTLCMHGALLAADAIRVKDDLMKALRQQIREKTTGEATESIINMVNLELIPLISDDPSKLYALVIIELDLTNKKLEELHPIMVTTDPEFMYPIRRNDRVPETRRMTESEMTEVFGSILP
eukprot:scaffold131_cov174-Ochromonas_danica.AAC.20